MSSYDLSKPMIKSACYMPEVFTVSSEWEARQVILAPEDDLSSEERWERETPYIANLISSQFPLAPHSLVLDYGCGIGRIAKELIGRYGCRVVGVDISPTMLALAPGYVQSNLFQCCSLWAAPYLPISFDLVLSVWVLQHVLDLQASIELISSRMRPDGKLFVLNESLGGGRVLPTDKGWVGDGLDVVGSLDSTFEHSTSGLQRLDPKVVTQEVTDRTFWGIWQKRSISSDVKTSPEIDRVS